MKTNKSEIKKVIIQQNQIDFSGLSEEEQKEIWWFDVEKLACEHCKHSDLQQPKITKGKIKIIKILWNK